MSELSFTDRAPGALADAQLRRNLRNATTTIRARRVETIAGIEDWAELRDAAATIKDGALAHLGEFLPRFADAVERRGGVVHWARDGDEACAIVADVVQATGAREVVKVKSMVTEEIGLNSALAQAGITAHETDLAELIVQLAGDTPSHIVVPALHRNRSEIRDLFARTIGPADLTDDPVALCAAARSYLREKFLSVPVAISGANFGAADTGSICVVESEGNGRMCLTLSRVLITLMGVEKVLPNFGDLEVMLQVLAPSATGERMNPYTSVWTGVHDDDGPAEFHLVLVDAGRTQALADPVGRDALRCIRCAACLNICPVYERVGGHTYGSVYPGPIGAILTPQLRGIETTESLPWASSLCGACADVCPVKIDIPELLIHLRERRVSTPGIEPWPTRTAMRMIGVLFGGRRRYEFAQRMGIHAARLVPRPLRRLRWSIGPLAGWTRSRDLPAPPNMTFRDWWRGRGRRNDPTARR